MCTAHPIDATAIDGPHLVRLHELLVEGPCEPSQPASECRDGRSMALPASLLPLGARAGVTVSRERYAPATITRKPLPG